MDVSHTVERIFRQHSGVRIASPLLMPKSALYDHTDQYVCLMDQGGGLVALPYDLRVSIGSASGLRDFTRFGPGGSTLSRFPCKTPIGKVGTSQYTVVTRKLT